MATASGCSSLGAAASSSTSGYGWSQGTSANDRPAVPGGVGEAACYLATASRRFDWTKAAELSPTD